ncbi:MAG TPA: multicopper oxidase domain-containing protein [Thermoanaerobaculia bacterium]|nr:multicopper oxidase domain-containing protein [Thermoanaerobaculia bacterium]
MIMFEKQRRVISAAVLSGALLLPVIPAHAQGTGPGTGSGKPKGPGNATSSIVQSQEQVACLGQKDLLLIPELSSNGTGRLRARITVTSERDRMTFRNPISGQPGMTEACWPQWVRAFRSPDAIPPYPPLGDLNELQVGPTLRARVGDFIELTFLNNVNPAVFGASSDGPTKVDAGDIGDCDNTSAPYPGNVKGPDGKFISDTFPNCFHGSTTANLHFHGTHTNPNTTGDNVFLEILSSKRLVGTPDIAPPDFTKFFGDCEVKLAPPGPVEWPRKWSDLPPSWTGYQTEPPPPGSQKALLTMFDNLPSTPAANKLWPKNQAQLDLGNWPQYYLGSYPYCFKLPDYDAAMAAPPVDPMAAMNHGGAVERDGSAASNILSEALPTHPLRMGQAPGTHWYHAHKHGSTAIDVSNGMSGAFIIEGKYDDEINEKYKAYGPYFTRKVPVMVINQFGVSPNLKSPGGADRGPDFSVNGRVNPIVTMRPGEVQMWRIVNSSSRGGVRFAPSTVINGAPATFQWRRIAQDGVQFNDFNYQLAGHQSSSFLLAAGNRADLLVKAPSCPSPLTTCTASLQVQNEVDPENPSVVVNLLTVKVAGTPYNPPMPFMDHAPSFPPFLGDIEDSEVKGWQTIDFATVAQVNPPAQPAIHTINGKKFDGEVGVSVLLNKVEEWKITNATLLIAHPFHIHINPFQVVEVFDPNVTLPGVTGNGTIAMNFGSKTVTGTGTAFTKQLAVRYLITTATGGTGTIKSIESDTSLTLTENALQNGSGAYTYVAPKYVTTQAGILPGQCFLDPNGDPESWKPCNPSVVPSSKNQIWWDVFPIPSGLAANKSDGKGGTIPIIIPGYFKMRSRFVDYPGYYVIHCHILAHEDRGMMTVVEVTPLLPPFSHH